MITLCLWRDDEEEEEVKTVNGFRRVSVFNLLSQWSVNSPTKWEKRSMLAIYFHGQCFAAAAGDHHQVQLLVYSCRCHCVRNDTNHWRLQ